MKKLNFTAILLMRYFFLKVTRSVLVSLSIWTMVFAPVAYGAQASKQFDQITQNELKQLVINLGLNKRMTYKEFWEKTKHLYPTKVHRDVEATFLSQPSALMPKFEVTFTQDSSGKKVPTLKITDRGNTTNVQIIGELNEWARINGVSLSESDLKQIRPALEKLNPATVQLETYKKDFNRFTGFPRMTPELWKSLKPEARARYIIEMRLLWFEARRVIEANSPSAKFTPANPKQKKSPINPKQKGKKTSSAEDFLQFLIGADANAETGVPAPATAAERQAILNLFSGQQSSNFKDEVQKILADPGYGGKACQSKVPGAGGGCVVAGQVAPAGAGYNQSINSNSADGKELRCACNYHSVLVQRYLEIKEKSNENTAGDYLIEQAKYNKRCDEINKSQQGGIWVACNPLVYSFDAKSGDPICVNTRKAGFQQATAYSSADPDGQSCDQRSGRLGPAPEAFDKLNVMDRSNRAAALKIIDEAQAKDGYQQTKNYLEGMAQAKAKGLLGDKSLMEQLEKGKYDQKLDDFLVDTQVAFESEINRAMQLCVSNDPKNRVDKNHDLGCQQLHRKWLFTEKILEQYRSRGCLDGSTYTGAIAKTDGDDLKAEKTSLNKNKAGSAALCKCKDGSFVGLNKNCVAQPGPVDPPPKLAACAQDSKIHGEFTCLCPNGNEYMRTESEGQNNAGYHESCFSPAKEKQNCVADYPGVPAADMEPTSCLCITGSNKGELPVIGKAPVASRTAKIIKRTEKTDTETTTSETTTIPEKEKLESSEQYTCNPEGFNWLKWLGIAALAIGAGYLLHKLLKKDKDPDYTCNEGPNFRYNQQLGFCYCPLKDTCTDGLYNADCSACVPQPVCTPPKSNGSYPACSCPNTCLMGTNHPVTCECEEGGNGNVNPDNNGGGLPPVTPVGR